MGVADLIKKFENIAKETSQEVSSSPSRFGLDWKEVDREPTGKMKDSGSKETSPEEEERQEEKIDEHVSIEEPSV